MALLSTAGCGGGTSRPPQAAPSPSPASLPSSPPAAAKCAGKVLDRRDIQHPDLGAVRVFLIRRPASQEPTGCVTAVSGSGNVLTSTDVDIHDEKSLRFADPATDATKNTFVTYNPGRYDGVLVFVPSTKGFEDIGWSTPEDHYSGGRFAYYNAKLAGPGADGRYTITRYEKSCDPNCAEGITTEVTLHWNGHDYRPAE
ncbi:hypothetical protein DP939_06370 [Spongiactinospora rosea]|uniref:Uncharacterized protein n=1 Tax=Spongiactinospora rosea TaxID=2248750 RepID=A0A366M527_9ACTN|nr:hypothetical protein DP939_06370 [Spongiactinospora rosea]